MAQSGFTPISVYHSSTPTAQPLAANLVAGELAINTADGKLFYKDSGGAVQVIASQASTSSTFSAGTTGLTPATATSGAVTLAGTLNIANGGTGQITASAAFNALSPITTTGDLIVGTGTNTAGRLAVGASGYVLTSNGTTSSWAATGPSGATLNETSGVGPYYIVGSSGYSGNLLNAYVDTGISYNASTGDTTSPQFVASNGLLENASTVNTSYTIAAGNNAISVGPVTVASGKAVTVSSGQRWVIL